MIAYAVVSKRPPLLGYNHNVRHAGRLFHVQTEDSGLSRLYVTTHLFIEGTILSTTRTQYTADEPDEVVQKKMQTQHKTMLKRLRDGDFDHISELPSRSQTAKPVEQGIEGAPSEVTSDPAQSTLRMALPDLKQDAVRVSLPGSPMGTESDAAARPAPAASSAASGEVGRPSNAPLGPILAPVAPPPILPRATPASGSLAERLRRTPGSALTGSPPPPSTPAPALPSQPAAPARPSGPHPVLEFEAELPEDEDDLEPAVTIEVTEPQNGDGEDSDRTILTPVTPENAPALLPGPVTAPITVPATPIIDPITAPIPPSPTAALPIIAPRAPVAPPIAAVAPPVMAARPIVPTGLRSKPTAEGVVLQRTLVPTPLVRPGVDSVRTTSPRARPTAPAPLAVAQPAHALDDERSLDPVVLAYLAREHRPRG